LLKADADANIPDNVSFTLLFGLFVVTLINVVDCQSMNNLVKLLQREGFAVTFHNLVVLLLRVFY
jgi:hypothetical protein